jgi:hypothetical protein
MVPIRSYDILLAAGKEVDMGADVSKHEISVRKMCYIKMRIICKTQMLGYINQISI